MDTAIKAGIKDMSKLRSVRIVQAKVPKVDKKAQARLEKERAKLEKEKKKVRVEKDKARKATKEARCATARCVHKDPYDVNS